MEKDDVLANLGYFTEWGGHRWEYLCRYAIQSVGDLRGKTVLEIGPRYGKMSACFALLGARVVGIETSASVLQEAEKEIKRWGVDANVSFIHYDGNIAHCNILMDSEFDFISPKVFSYYCELTY
jgi:protein-L-isoaspartate O-methyltransferase